MASQTSLPQIEKLKGRENYSNWKFAMKAYLEMIDLWCAISDENPDAKTSKKVLSIIILSVDPINYAHIQSAASAKEAWVKLEKAFEDSGLTRRVGLLRKLVTTQLQSHASIDSYVNEIMVTAQKLNSIGFNVDDEWIGTLLLAGLPDEYKPMIMGLESSGIPITGDAIKVKLLQDVKVSTNTEINSNTALMSNDKNKPRSPRCYVCNKLGHVAKDCFKRKKNNNNFRRRNNDSRSNNYKDDNERTAFLGYYVPNQGPERNNWYLDSCASSHMTNNKEAMENVKNTDHKITAADNEQLTATAVGDMPLVMNVNSYKEGITARDVLYVPKVAANLLSVSKIVKKGHSVTFNQKGGIIKNDTGKIVGKASEENGVYRMHVVQQKAYLLNNPDISKIWHRRLGHLNRKAMNILKDWSTGMDNFTRDDNICEVCVKAKDARKPFKSSMSQTNNKLELIHTDLCGPMEVGSLSGCKYLLTFVDDYTRKVYGYFLKEKSEVPDKFNEFKNLVENETGLRIKKIRSDNGKEYVNLRMKAIMEKCGIRHELTVPYSPQQNGVAERLNRTIIEKARSLLFDANSPKRYWAEAVSTAIYLCNRSPTKAVKGKTPYEAWNGRKPNLQHLRIFGTKAMVHVPKEQRKKWDPKCIKLTFLGYQKGVKGWRFIDPSNDKIYVSRDVTFLEKENVNVSQNNNKVMTNEINNVICPIFQINSDVSNENIQRDNINNHDVSEEMNESPEHDNEFYDCDTNVQNVNSSENNELRDGMRTESEVQDSTEPVLRRSTRVRKKPERYGDCTTYYTMKEGSQVRVVIDEPQTADEALSSPYSDDWMRAMNEEHESLIRNKTYEIVDMIPGRKVLHTRWVYKLKENPDRTIRFKARLVVKGCAQKPGIDYQETYSPVVKYASLRYLFAFAARHKLHIDQLDVTTAYLYGDLEEEIYVRPPKELIKKENENKIWSLKKSVYGLKQSGRCWNKRIDNALQSFGLTQCRVDPCIYYKRTQEGLVIIAIYVDDILLFYDNEKFRDEMKNKLKSEFLMKDMGPAKHCLGMRITRGEGCIQLDQAEYTGNILNKFNMQDSHPMATPMELGISFNDEGELPDDTPYQEAVGSLLYISQITRPDIAYAVGVVSRFNHNPKLCHWKAVKRIFRYLKGTVDYKLEYKCSENSVLECYSDADWGNEINGRHSVTGSCFRLQGGLISWYSKKQRTVALSTTEAEYMALSFTTQEALWLRQLINEIDRMLDIPTKIFCDNMGAIQLSNNLLTSQKSKHIDVRYHFLRQHIQNKVIEVNYLHTDQMLADVFTKPMPRVKLDFFVNKLGLVNNCN